MFRHRSPWVVALAACGVAGCAPGMAGSWRTVDVYPKGASFPVNELNLDADGRYTATGYYSAKGDYDGEPHTTTGKYSRRGQQLELAADGGPAVVYKTRRRLDGKIEMTLKIPGQKDKVTAVFDRSGGP